MKLRHQHSINHHHQPLSARRSSTSTNSSSNSSIVNNFSPPRPQSLATTTNNSLQSPLPPRERIASLDALRLRYPFASGKRRALLWKFLQEYDYPPLAAAATEQQQQRLLPVSAISLASVAVTSPIRASEHSGKSSSRRPSATATPVKRSI